MRSTRKRLCSHRGVDFWGCISTPQKKTNSFKPLLTKLSTLVSFQKTAKKGTILTNSCTLPNRSFFTPQLSAVRKRTCSRNSHLGFGTQPREEAGAGQVATGPHSGECAEPRTRSWRYGPAGVAQGRDPSGMISTSAGGTKTKLFGSGDSSTRIPLKRIVVRFPKRSSRVVAVISPESSPAVNRRLS